MFSYETNSPHLFTSQNRKFLMNDIEIDEFHTSSIPDRIIFNDLEAYVKENPVDFNSDDDVLMLREKFQTDPLPSP